MKGFADDIELLTDENSNFRRVLYTAKHLQLVLMALLPGEEIGEEAHADRDQFFRVEKGEGDIWIDGVRTRIKSGMAMIYVNLTDRDLKELSALHGELVSLVKHTGEKTFRILAELERQHIWVSGETASALG